MYGNLLHSSMDQNSGVKPHPYLQFVPDKRSVNRSNPCTLLPNLLRGGCHTGVCKQMQAQACQYQSPDELPDVHHLDTCWHHDEGINDGWLFGL